MACEKLDFLHAIFYEEILFTASFKDLILRKFRKYVCK